MNQIKEKFSTRISRSLEQAKNIMTSKENDNYSKLEELKVRPLKIYENWVILILRSLFHITLRIKRITQKRKNWNLKIEKELKKIWLIWKTIESYEFINLDCLTKLLLKGFKK